MTGPSECRVFTEGSSNHTAIIGVSNRATSREASTATTAVQPNSRKKSPAMPLIIAVGRNTTTRLMVVAMTAKKT